MSSPHSDHIPLQKQRLRQDALVSRGRLSDSQKQHFALAAADHFADHPVLAYNHPVALYIAMRGEMDVLPIMQRMERFKKTFCLPYSHAETHQLSFHTWDGTTPLQRDQAGAKAPSPSSEPCTPKIILIPLLAFDALGNRLGYGGGYYDRTIQHMRGQPGPPLCFGVAYSIQEVSLIPTEPTDQPLDGILTETGVSMF